MEFLKLYDKENRDILYSMSWLNKNSNFDKSIGSFEEIDLFTFLENISKFDYKKDIFYDDIYYVLEYTEDSILHLIHNINKEIKREHKIVPISQAKEFDKKTILWLSRQDGRTIREKLKNNKIKAVKRYKNVDTYENRVFKIFLKKLLLIEEKRGHIQGNEYLIGKIRQWLRSDDAKSINEYGNIVYNNILLHHPYYSKIFKSYKWLNRLNEKVKGYKEIYPEQIRTILKFEILTQLHFKSKEYIFPRTLQIGFNDNEFDLKVENCWLRLNLDEMLSKVTTNVLEKKLPFQVINKFSEQIITKQLKIKSGKNRIFSTKNKIDEVFIDFFRLFPIAKVEEKIIEFPITMKQKIDDSIVNANNTKIIDLNYKIYTLPEVLKTFDTSILKYFLDDFTHYFKDTQLNYIIPDYVNVFEFAQVKKTINSYFKKNRTVPKSIVAGLKHIFDKDMKTNDTLLYIQRNHNNELYVTPLLVKYEEKLKKITNGFYLERHPTKKIKNISNDILSSLNKVFEKETSKKLLNKFLQNGLKGIKKENIVFYEKEKIIDLNKFQIPRNKYNNIDKIKPLYKTNNLFSKKNIFLEDSNKENLANFKKLMQCEANGFNLWREHLPNLSMEIIRNGYFDEFVLVDEKTEIIDKKINISDTFIIPRNTDELSFPLVFDNEKIGYIAYLSSKEFPFNENIKCKLELIYDYEGEDIYQLNFIPLATSFLPIKVKWQKEEEKIFDKLIYPQYPNSIDIENDIENSIVKELNRLLVRLELIEKGRGNENKYPFLKQSYTKALFSRYWQNGNSVMNSENGELKQLIKDIFEKIILQNKLPWDLQNNIFLFLSYLHEDLIIYEKSNFIINEFKKKEHLYGLSLGCLNRDWQNDLFKNIFFKQYEEQIIILNIAFWRCERIIENISSKNLLILLKYIVNQLSNMSERDIYFKSNSEDEKEILHQKREKNIVTYLEFLLASLRTKSCNDVLHPNKLITKDILNILKSRSKYLIENYKLKSKINFGQIDKPDNLSKMPDILYAVIYYLSNEDIENKIIINEVTL